MSIELFEWPNNIQPPVYFANHQWAVTPYGLECLTLHYAIERSRLLERVSTEGNPYDVSDWVMHLAGKTWCDVQQFCEAFEVALNVLKIKGRTTVNIEKSKALALREKGEQAAFSAFMKNELNEPDLEASPTTGRLIRGSCRVVDLDAAAELYRERKLRARK